MNPRKLKHNPVPKPIKNRKKKHIVVY